MIKCLSIFRHHYHDLYLITRTFPFLRIFMMSEIQNNSAPPIGSFEINPLMVKTEFDSGVNDCSSNTTTVNERKETDETNHDKEIIDKDTGVYAVNMNLEQAKESLHETQLEQFSVKSNSLKSDRNESKMLAKTNAVTKVRNSSALMTTTKSEVVQMSMTKTKSGDVPTSMTKRKLGDDPSSMTKSGDVPSFMMKLVVTGPPKCKFDEKKTVLPQSLLQGVTDLVKKQCLKDCIRGNTDNNSNKELPMEHVCSLDRAEGTDNKAGVKSGRQFSKKSRSSPEEDIFNRQVKDDLLAGLSTENRNFQLEADNAKDVPFTDYSNEGTSKGIFSKHEKDIETQGSGCSTPQAIEQDACVNSEFEETKQLSVSTLSQPSTSEKGCGVDPFSEIDLDGLFNNDNKYLDTSFDSERVEKVIVGNTVQEEFHNDNKRKKKEMKQGNKSHTTQDIIYDLSALFSGELEKRRKRELKKQTRKAKNLERFSKGKKKAASNDTKDKQTETDEREEKPRKPSPNYFVAIQITDQQIKSGLKAVQDKVVEENDKLKPALNKLATLHLTMLVLCLKTEEDMERSRLALDKASEKLLSLYTDVSLSLDVSGLGHFRNNVVFAKVKHDHQVTTLKQVADIVEECFLEQEIISPDQRGFKPHITIMKLSSVKGSKKKGLKKIDEKLYSDFVDTDFGHESIHTLQLCAMMKPKDKHGYYQVEHKVQFAKVPDRELTESCSDNTEDISDRHDGEFKPIDDADSNFISEHTMDIEEVPVNNEKVLEIKSEGEIDTAKIVLKSLTPENDSALDLSIETDTPKTITKNIVLDMIVP